MLLNIISLLWFIGCESINVIYASSLGIVKVIAIIIVGCIPGVFSYLKEKEKTKQKEKAEEEETKRMQIRQEYNSKNIKTQADAYNLEIYLLTKTLTHYQGSQPPENIEKQMNDNLVEILKKITPNEFFKKFYQDEIVLPVHNSDENEKKSDTGTEEDFIKSLLKFISMAKDKTDEKTK